MGIGFEVRSRLKETPLFRGVRDSTIALLAEAALTITAQAGETLWPRGHKESEVLLLLEGWVGVEAVTWDGGRVLLRLLGPHDVLGPSQPARSQETPITSVALAQCTAVTWRTESWERANGHAKALLANLVVAQARTIGELERRCLGLSGDNVDCRLARMLLDLCRTAGHSTGDGVEIDLPLRREDLAGLVGSTLYTISRTMSRWQRAGWGAGGRKRGVVSPRRARAEMAEGGREESVSASPVRQANLR
mgnify:FL=1